FQKSEERNFPRGKIAGFPYRHASCVSVDAAATRKLRVGTRTAARISCRTRIFCRESADGRIKEASFCHRRRVARSDGTRKGTGKTGSPVPSGMLAGSFARRPASVLPHPSLYSLTGHHPAPAASQPVRQAWPAHPEAEAAAPGKATRLPTAVVP